MQGLFKQIWQWLKDFFGQLFGTESTKAINRRRKRNEPEETELSDTDYEFLFSQLLEGIAHGWHEGRILKFFQQLGESGKQRYWVAWLERFGARVLASPAPNQQLAGRMMRLGELAQSFGEIAQMGEVSYSIGRQLYNRNAPSTVSSVWEYDGPDVESPVQTVTETPESLTGQETDAVETMTLDQLLERLQHDNILATQIAGQLGIETTDPQTIIDALIEQLSAAQPDTSTQTTPDTVEGWFNQGLQQANSGDLNGAIASWEKALALNPNLAQAWHNRGSALANLGRIEEAIASYKKALEINTSDPQAWNALAYALFNAGRWEEAVMGWDKVIELRPNSFESWFNRGGALENSGQIDRAIASYKKALEINPDFDLAKNKLQQLQKNNSNNSHF